MQQVPERPSDGHLSEDEISRPHRILFHAADLAARRNLPELMQELSRRLHVIFNFRFTNYALHDPDKNVMRVQVLDEGLHFTDHETEVSIDHLPPGGYGPSNNRLRSKTWIWPQATLGTRLSVISRRGCGL